MIVDAAASVPIPTIASRKPFYCELKSGRTIAWCQCGLSKRQPYCDGRSHLGTGFSPLLYTPGAALEEVLLCGCKHTGTPPFCDGAHSNLPGGYAGDDRSDDERARVRRAAIDAAGVRRLDGQCYVIAPTATRPADTETFWMRRIIAPSMGALHQSQFYIAQGVGTGPVLDVGDTTVILFVAAGTGQVEIGDRHFAIRPGDGVHIRPGEAFRLVADAALSVFASGLPGIEDLHERETMPTHFDAAYPERVRGVDDAQRSAMGPRYFQMLVDKTIGSTDAAQFIGHIPPSRAEMHRHLYEEALIILSGSGTIWTEDACAQVAAGDVIFLPRKQIHSLECIAPEGMDVVGVIHPGDNPAINY
jgi:mannose-6-phosphate isomerase-like protein (cupin superfamily)/CDGSH-type Zn-finger protein